MATFNQNWHLGVGSKMLKNIGRALYGCKNTFVRNNGFGLFLSLEHIELCRIKRKAVFSVFI